ncbi:DUF4149 domain-containing protein [Rugamonas sp. CCM 8940]|uniref:DUF4149 domain-containing protein n=1 Tax=Rugamonas sp. CCM 8940 TaxID=2765359 RepID=UPI0018F2E50A|nr:DUF4149 domain-containing protein [Rugamonas sp. CCM 8940]MBJ7312994.1 DUF4149 domain-containing protein [Rugamonas sp. CCM 8940]
MLLARARLLLATLWAGSLWTVGYLAAPTLFATLSDRVLAGTIAASLFRVEALLSLACGAALLLLLWLGKDFSAARRRTLLLIVLAMLACTLASHFGLQPLMAELRAAAGPAGVMESAAKGRFGMLHGISSCIFLVQSLLAGWLVIKQ